VFVYDSKDMKSHQVTAGYYDDWGPAFDPEGKFLYFVSGRNFNPIYSDIQNTWIYTNTQQVFAMTLRKDQKSPLATRNDEESDEDAPDDKEGKKDKNRPIEAVVIEFDELERRAVKLPFEPGQYSSLQPIKGKLLLVRRANNGAADRKRSILSYDLKERKVKTVQEGINNFIVAASGKKMLVSARNSWKIRGTGGGGNWPRGGDSGDSEKKNDSTLKLGNMACTVDPVAEWRQMFVDGWRIQRDFFYDPNMHGVDWPAVRKQYGDLLDQCVTRWDLNYLLGEMIGEINASHTYRWGGDSESAESLNVGLLGCDFDLVNGHYKISHIIDGAAWDSEARSPLNEPGLNIEAGSYLLAVNGIPPDTSKDPWAAFQGLGGKTIALTLNDKPDTDGAREVFVKTITSERRLRYLEAIERTRKSVADATDGQIGYIYVPNTGRNGQNELMRQMRAQFKAKALIVDERWNGGGQLPDRFVELLNRPILNYWGVRDGADWQSPMVAHNGPKAMLINGRAGSGGDAFPFYFREAGCGKLIGTRTWGGLIGYTGVPGLIDGGTVIAPTFGIYNTKGEWIIEGYGVDPDIEVVSHPTSLAKGGDPQLERAIDELLKELKDKPPVTPKKPEYPNRSGK
jgi:tricorn protease